MSGVGLWDFALRVYGAPGVAPACLELQDTLGADVPFLLFAGWMDARGVALDAAEIARLDREIAAWRAEIVRPLRAIRRRLKTGPAPAPGPQSEALRDAIKAAELSAEKLELERLEAIGTLYPAGTGPQLAAHGNLRRALAHYAGGPPDAGAEAALAVIASAIAQSPGEASDASEK